MEQPIAKPPPTRRNHHHQQQQQYSECLECPRCGSTNTKFCYYNNYNTSQPRHLCKACKRHWTKGGTLRNVGVGGARKNKRLTRTSSSNVIASETCTTSSISSSGNTSHTKAHVFAHTHQNSCNQRISTGGENFVKGEKCKFTCSAASPPENENVGFCYSTADIAALENIIPPSATSSNAYGFAVNQDNVSLESTITTTTVNHVLSEPASWQQPPTTNGAMDDVPGYWNWNDVEHSFLSTLDTTWDDTEIKF